MIIQPSTPPVEIPQQERRMDSLIAAGSHISFADIHRKQMDIPLVRKKYYPASDVDKLLVMMNGILSRMAQSHHRSESTILELRQENDTLQADHRQQQEELSKLSQSNIEQAQVVKALRQQVGQQAVILNDQHDEIAKLTEERQKLVRFIQGLKA